MKIATTFDPETNIVLYEGETLNLLSQYPDAFVNFGGYLTSLYLGKEYESKQDLETYLRQQREVINECYRVLKSRRKHLLAGGKLCEQWRDHTSGLSALSYFF